MKKRIYFVNNKGKKRWLPASATIKELRKKWVTVRLVDPKVPMKDGEYRNI